ELGGDRGRKRTDGESLGQSGDALEQHVAVGEQADQQALGHRPPADDAPAALVHELADQPAFLLDPSGIRQAGSTAGVGREALGNGRHEGGIYYGQSSSGAGAGASRRGSTRVAVGANRADRWGRSDHAPQTYRPRSNRAPEIHIVSASEATSYSK